MTREQIIDRLRQNEAALRAKGVMHAALFGSRARGDDRADSDTDIMVELDPTARVTVFDYAGIKEYIGGLFDGPVDVVNRNGLKPYVKPAVTADAVYAFWKDPCRPAGYRVSHRSRPRICVWLEC
jgi:predicted nucleotidyltransferase